MADRLGILYIDDSAPQLDAFRQALVDGPYDVRTANSARQAEGQITQPGIELVVIDYHMPDMTGDRCLQMLRRRAPRDRQIRYYLYTTDPDAFRRHREMGFDGVLMLKGKTPVRTQIDAIARTIVQYRRAGGDTE